MLKRKQQLKPNGVHWLLDAAHGNRFLSVAPQIDRNSDAFARNRI